MVEGGVALTRPSARLSREFAGVPAGDVAAALPPFEPSVRELRQRFMGRVVEGRLAQQDPTGRDETSFRGTGRVRRRRRRGLTASAERDLLLECLPQPKGGQQGARVDLAISFGYVGIDAFGDDRHHAHQVLDDCRERPDSVPGLSDRRVVDHQRRAAVLDLFDEVPHEQ